MWDRVYHWIDERSGIKKPLEDFLYKPVPSLVGWTHTLGFTLLFLLTVQLVTGIFLALNYSPSPDAAYASVAYISDQVLFGDFVRGLHRWAANLMVVFVGLHMVRVFLFGSYKYPRELTWILGVLLLIVVIGFVFTGVLLPWDQKGYWATVVAIKIVGSMPLIGDFLMRIIQGGEALGEAALTRFYVLHVILLPGAVVLLATIHVYMVHKLGESGTWKVSASEEEKENAAKGRPFYPYQAIKDVTVALAVFLVVIVLAIFFGAPLERIADPNDTTYLPRPDWPFLFLFQLLKYFAGPLEPVGTIVIPFTVLAILILLPFIDRNRDKRPYKRPLATGAMVLGVLGLGVLTILGALSPRTPEELARPPQLVLEQLSSEEQMGIELYTGSGCIQCHAIGGVGGVVGPDLTNVVRRGHDVAWLLSHIQSPGSAIEKELKPAFAPSPENLKAISLYLVRLNPNSPAVGLSGITGAQLGRIVYVREDCITCHEIDFTGPDLFGVTDRRDRKYLIDHFKDPKAFDPNTIMPSYASLPEEELHALVDYLATLE